MHISDFFSSIAGLWRFPGGRRPPDAREYQPRFPKFDLIDQLFIIRAIILRDVKVKHLKLTGVGFWVEFLMPIVVIVLHYYIFIALGRYMPGNIPCELFVLGGFPLWFTFRNCTSYQGRLGEDGPGTFLVPGVTPSHFLIAKAVWEGAMMLMVLFGGLVISDLIFSRERLPDVPVIVFCFIMAACLGTGYRLTFDALAWLWPLFKSLKKPLTWLLFLTSGVYVGAQAKKQDFLTEVCWYNPLIHLIEPIRVAIWPGYPDAKVYIVYAISWSLGLLCLGLVLKRLLRPYAHHA
jgi:ABC-type polysaccharide/polyol phosphate export permease